MQNTMIFTKALVSQDFLVFHSILVGIYFILYPSTTQQYYREDKVNY